MVSKIFYSRALTSFRAPTPPLILIRTRTHLGKLKKDSKVGCDVISDNPINMKRIPDDSSSLTAEAKAVYLALDFIITCDTNNKFNK